MIDGDPQRPILIFDSGLGGLSVLPQVLNAFPGQDIHYVADDAFFPFGDKAPDAVRARLLEILPRYVRRVAPHCVVLACNTGCLLAGEDLAASLPVPVYGCMPQIHAALDLSRTGLVAVIATPNTISVLQRSESDRARDLVFVASEDFAPAVEDHLHGDLAAMARIEQELRRCFIERGGRRVDVVVLGCTHYALLGDRLLDLCLWSVALIGSAVSFSSGSAPSAGEEGAAQGRFFLELTSGDAPAPIWGEMVAAIRTQSS